MRAVLASSALNFHTSGIRVQDCSKSTINRKSEDDVIICRHDVIVKFFGVFVFFLLSLVAGPYFMSISPLLLEL